MTKKNDKGDFMIEFSKLSSSDLKEALQDVLKTPFLYRDNLNFSAETISLGIEIEFEKAKKKRITEFLENYPQWLLKNDHSLNHGLEINSPIFYNTKESWQELKRVMEELKKERAEFYHNAGAHFHVGTQVLGKDVSSWKNFLFMYAYYEDVLSRFFYGERLVPRVTTKTYAYPLAALICENIEEIKNMESPCKIRNIMPLTCSNTVSFFHTNFSYLDEMLYRNTIEFRGPNGTREEGVWQNNINVGVNLLLLSQNSQDNWLKYYYLLKENPITDGKMLFYKYIHLKKALEICDLLFEDDIDKIYFLKQYLKNYKEDKPFCLTKTVKF